MAGKRGLNDSGRNVVTDEKGGSPDRVVTVSGEGSQRRVFEYAVSNYHLS